MLALDEAGVKPDFIVGTSVGAINGAWLASQRPVQGLADVWTSLQGSDIYPHGLIGGFLGFVGLRNYLISSRSLRSVIRRNLGFAKLEDAPTPLHVVATDVRSGTAVALSRGPAEEALLASSAIPGVFPPVSLAGRTLIDGGVVNNTPISFAAEFGADTIWVLATGYSCALERPPRTTLSMLQHALNLLIHQRLSWDIAEWKDQRTLRVVPPLCPVDVSPTDFSHSEQLIQRARQHTAKWVEQFDGSRGSVGQFDLMHGHGSAPR